MSQRSGDPTLDLKRLVNLLEKTASMVEQISLTGAMEDGVGAARRTYNNAVKYLLDQGEVPELLFQPLPDDAPLGEVGVSCGQLAEYLSGGLPDGDGEGSGNVHRGLIIGNLNLGGGPAGDELSDLVREKLAEFLGQAKSEPETSATDEGVEASASMSARGNRAPAPVARLSLPAGQARVEEVQSVVEEARVAR